MELSSIQNALRERGLDAWLFYDHHHRDPIAYRVLGVPESLMVTRRWYYLVPAQGEPQKMVHRIESHHLDSLSGKKTEYSGWEELEGGLRQMLAPYKKLAMQYSPNNRIFIVSLVDAGTVELLRSFGHEIVSSADLVTMFEATWSEEQVKSHFEAAKLVDEIVAAAFPEIGQRVRGGGTNEYEIQRWFRERFDQAGLVTDEGPIVAVNANSGNPHYEPSEKIHQPIKQGDFVLLDVWAKRNTPNATYYDITWTGVVGQPTDRQREIFDIVTRARDAGIKKAQDGLKAGKVAGWEIDKATRDVIDKAGYGKYFTHRTGHSIATEVHGNGANMDNLETHDIRELLPNTCFSVEPGIYLPEFGVRSEVDMLVRKASAEVTGRIQKELIVI
jgi:Xaa-Pro aminopeptidase